MAEEQENELVPEEEVTAIPGWAPTVSLEVQDFRTGEEEEEEIYSQRSKLFRFKDGEWKERGLGDSKLLRHKVSGKVRYMMRQEKTGKIVANHFVFEHDVYCKLQNQNQSDKTLLWTALDYAEDEQQAEKFALKFKDKDLAEKFRSAFDGAKVAHVPVNGQADGGPSSEPRESGTLPAEPANAAGEENDLVPEEEVTVVPGWAPTVTLQPQEIRTGEEDEDEIYSQRSKLYRFRDNEWKERGLGDSKLLRHRATGKIRYMMRQEKTGKIVANHYVVEYPPYCQLASNAGNDKIWTWTAMDWAEDEQQVEQFSLKFKDADLARQFKQAFDSAKAETKTEPAEVQKPEEKAGDADVADATEAGVSPQSNSRDSGNPFAGVSLFAASPQSSGTALTSLATSGGLFSSLASTGGVASSGGLFAATASASTGSLFSSSSTSASSGLFGGGLFASANTSGGLFSGMSFGANKADSPQEQAGSKSSAEAAAPFASLTFAASTGGLFGNASGSLFSSGGLFGNSGNSSSSGSGLFSGTGGGGSLFAGLPESSSGGIFSNTSTATTGIFSSAASGSLFSAASGGILGATTTTAATEHAPSPSPGLWAGATANGAQDDEQLNDQYVLEEEVTQIPGWAPSVTLEVKDYVETGEEEEEEMYSQRSKLLRFVDNEWKERGTGDAKILRHRVTGKCRFLMRQEKTSKIVANHFIIEQKPYCDLVHNAGNAKIWVWTALDWADDEQKVEKFALRFKTEELAEEFEEAFNAARGGEMVGDAGDAHDDDDWEKAEAYGSADGGGLAALAALQANSGWRCAGCRLQWAEQDIECSVCDIARPGYESQVAAAKAEKESGKQNAAAAFLGTTQSSAAGNFAPSSSSTANAGIEFGFAAAPSTAQSGPSIFGTSASSSGSLFGGTSSSSFFGASCGSDRGAAASTQGASTQGAFTGFGGTAGQSCPAPAGKSESMLPPPPPAVPSAGQDPGCGQGASIYSGYPCAQHFPLPHMQSCMAQMGMAGMLGPGMCGFGGAAPSDNSRVEALERSVKEMQDKLKDMRDSLDTERQERSKVEIRLQIVERRLQEEESRSSRAEARVAAVEAQTKQGEALVEGLRRQLERSPAEDTRLAFQRSLEEQLAPLRRGLEQKSTEEMRLLTKVLEQGRDADTSAALKQRLEALESRLDRMGMDMPIMTIRPPPERASYFQGLQVQQTGRRLANGYEDEPHQGKLHLVDPKPLLRRIP